MLWEKLEKILLEMFPEASEGRPHIDWRKAINGIIYQMRSGCQWNHLPRDFGSDRSIHRWFTIWCKTGFWERVWQDLLNECEELGDVDWTWQSVDGWLGKARLGGDEVGENPTDRAKNGTKKSIIVEKSGGPLGITLAPANRHDSKVLRQTIESIVVDRPKVSAKHPQNLCLDKAYDTPAAQEVVSDRKYSGHTRRIEGRGWYPRDSKKFKAMLDQQKKRE